MPDQATDLRDRYPSVAGPPGREHLDVEDAAALLGVKESWLKKAGSSGRSAVGPAGR